MLSLAVSVLADYANLFHVDFRFHVVSAADAEDSCVPKVRAVCAVMIFPERLTSSDVLHNIIR
jgi:hypothetical protein